MRGYEITCNISHGHSWGAQKITENQEKKKAKNRGKNKKVSNSDIFNFGNRINSGLHDLRESLFFHSNQS